MLMAEVQLVPVVIRLKSVRVQVNHFERKVQVQVQAQIIDVRE